MSTKVGAVTTLASAIMGLCCLSGGAAPKPDACEARVPDALKTALSRDFPGYRLPRFSDNLGGDIEYNKQHGGDGCLGVATGDFNGDGQMDYGLLLAAPKGEQTLLVAALRTSEGWKLERLRTWEGERFRLYAAVAAPGKYTRSESFDYPPGEPNEKESVESTTPGIVTGRTEASGIYYFWTPAGWVHVWAID